MITKHDLYAEIDKLLAGSLSLDALKKLDLLYSVCHELEASGEAKLHESHEHNDSHKAYAHAGALCPEELKKWAACMVNADGSRGAHWTLEQSDAAAHSAGIDLARAGISPEAWYVAINMMYSDYAPTAIKYGVDRADFYACLAKDFLLDKDGGGAGHKLAGYYRGVVAEK